MRKEGNCVLLLLSNQEAPSPLTISHSCTFIITWAQVEDKVKKRKEKKILSYSGPIIKSLLDRDNSKNHRIIDS